MQVLLSMTTSPPEPIIAPRSRKRVEVEREVKVFLREAASGRPAYLGRP